MASPSYLGDPSWRTIRIAYALCAVFRRVTCSLKERQPAKEGGNFPRPAAALPAFNFGSRTVPRTRPAPFDGSRPQTKRMLPRQTQKHDAAKYATMLCGKPKERRQHIAANGALESYAVSSIRFQDKQSRFFEVLRRRIHRPGAAAGDVSWRVCRHWTAQIAEALTEPKIRNEIGRDKKVLR